MGPSVRAKLFTSNWFVSVTLNYFVENIFRFQKFAETLQSQPFFKWAVHSAKPSKHYLSNEPNGPQQRSPMGFGKGAHY
jgi:hypothetical protein